MAHAHRQQGSTEVGAPGHTQHAVKVACSVQFGPRIGASKQANQASPGVSTETAMCSCMQSKTPDSNMLLDARIVMPAVQLAGTQAPSHVAVFPTYCSSLAQHRMRKHKLQLIRSREGPAYQYALQLPSTATSPSFRQLQLHVQPRTHGLKGNTLPNSRWCACVHTMHVPHAVTAVFSAPPGDINPAQQGHRRPPTQTQYAQMLQHLSRPVTNITCVQVYVHINTATWLQYQHSLVAEPQCTGD